MAERGRAVPDWFVYVPLGLADVQASPARSRPARPSAQQSSTPSLSSTSASRARPRPTRDRFTTISSRPARRSSTSSRPAPPDRPSRRRRAASRTGTASRTPRPSRRPRVRLRALDSADRSASVNAANVKPASKCGAKARRSVDLASRSRSRARRSAPPHEDLHVARRDASHRRSRPIR